MQFTDFMHEDLIILKLLSDKKKNIIKELLSPLVKKGLISSEKTLAKAILDREKLGSTAIGDGVAIPHAKTPGLRQNAIVFGRSKKGINFDSIDGKPVNLFFLIVSPEGEVGRHLKMLARISRLLQDADFRETLLTSSTPRQILDYIAAKEIK